MKTKLTSLDVKCLAAELSRKLEGMTATNVYDVDWQTFLIKLHSARGGGGGEETLLLMESGTRLHTTTADRTSRNLVPSPFAERMRSHLGERGGGGGGGKRLEGIEQVGIERIFDLRFVGDLEGSSCHIVLEVFDEGNIVLADSEYTIVDILRTVGDGDGNVRFQVGDKYPIHLAKRHEPLPSLESVRGIVEAASDDESLRKVLNRHLVHGAQLLEHFLSEVGLRGSSKIGSGFQVERDLGRLMSALNLAENFMRGSGERSCAGYIVKEEEEGGKSGSTPAVTYTEFYPFLFRQNSNKPHEKFESFDKAVDEFFSKIEIQRQDRLIDKQKILASAHLEKVRKDNLKRIEKLKDEEKADLNRALLIEMNQDLIDGAIRAVRKALEDRMDWTALKAMTRNWNDSIESVEMDSKRMTMLLNPPTYVLEDGDTDMTPAMVDIDLEMSAFNNAGRYYEKMKRAAAKGGKTTDSLDVARRSVEKENAKSIEEIEAAFEINEAKESRWFDEFLWFVSSENYVVIGGRDERQNELIVDRYLKQGDVLVRADLLGASIVVVKNPTGGSIPPVTLNEAGTMALCHSAAWDSGTVTSCWWVRHDQVSRTSPRGCGLAIRGTKNYLPPASLVYGIGFLFKLEEACLERHANERRVKFTTDAVIEDGGMADSILNDVGRDGKSSSVGPEASVNRSIDEPPLERIGGRKNSKKIKLHMARDEVRSDAKTKAQTSNKWNRKAEKKKGTSNNNNKGNDKKRNGSDAINDRSFVRSNSAEEIVFDSTQHRRHDSGFIEDGMNDEDDDRQIQREIESINWLTGVPLPDDILHYCIPVCGPWTAINNYRFKVKLTPGSCDKGQAANVILESLAKRKRTTAAEKNLFRSVKIFDLIKNMPGNVYAPEPRI